MLAPRILWDALRELLREHGPGVAVQAISAGVGLAFGLYFGAVPGECADYEIGRPQVYGSPVSKPPDECENRLGIEVPAGSLGEEFSQGIAGLVFAIGVPLVVTVGGLILFAIVSIYDSIRAGPPKD